MLTAVAESETATAGSWVPVGSHRRPTAMHPASIMAGLLIPALEVPRSSIAGGTKSPLKHEFITPAYPPLHVSLEPLGTCATSSTAVCNRHRRSDPLLTSRPHATLRFQCSSRALSSMTSVLANSHIRLVSCSQHGKKDIPVLRVLHARHAPSSFIRCHRRIRPFPNFTSADNRRRTPGRTSSRQ